MRLIEAHENTIAGMRLPEPAGDDERWMLRALLLAERGRLTTSPNPMVGAVIVDGREVVGEGFHQRAGGPHAEVIALERAGDRASGATMYVTLEPCAHEGRTPPCARMLAGAGLGAVVMAMRDPNPLVAGKGEQVLRTAGVTVRSGVLGDVAARLNEAYLKWMSSGRPFVTLKMAMSMDGKVATRTGDSRWVTSGESRADVHRMRAQSDAVMVGIGTVLKDDPRLTARDVGAQRQPLRVVLDSAGRMPLQSKVLDGGAETLVAVSENASPEGIAGIQREGAEVIVTGGRRVDIGALLEVLAGRGAIAVLAEGGPTVAAALLEGHLVDRAVFYVAPKVIGGDDAPGPVGGEGADVVSAARAFEVDSVYETGPDLKIVSYPAGGES
jgi:diaminohydroxyphosphoribosylaminopyrimidine deaminase/5-amino-6-(5-phosphoribosylamino)uracil reductase